MEKTKKKKTPALAPHYINNKEFLEAMIAYRNSVLEATERGEEKPPIPEYIGDCFVKIATHLAFKPNYINYIFRDEMILDGIENCVIYIDNFDPDKGTNPFAYFTQFCYYAFLRRIAKEKKQLHTKYKYIESIDINSLILQNHDEETYDNEFIQYLQKQVMIAETGLAEEANAPKKESRKPLYMKKRDEDIKNGLLPPLKKDIKKSTKEN